jgi:hypothetical protein
MKEKAQTVNARSDVSRAGKRAGHRKDAYDHIPA